MELTTFNEMVEQMAMRQPDKSFLYWADKDRSITYAEGIELATKVAGMLAALGVGKGDRVGIFAHNGLDYKLAMLGAWKLGAISCHIDVKQAKDIVYFANNSSPKVLVYTHDMFPVIDRHRDRMSTIQHYLCMDGAQEGAEDWNALVEAAPPPPDIELNGNDWAHLSYTSRAGRSAKGMLLPHGYTVKATYHIADRLRLSSSDVTLGLTSPADSMGVIANLLPGIHKGATIGMMSKWNAASAWDEMEKRGVTYCTSNQDMSNEILEECRKRDRKPSALRTIVTGDGPILPKIKQAYRDEFGIFLVESYGQKELGSFVALGCPQVEPPERLVAVGQALPGKEVRIVDENYDEVPMGDVGEICIRGDFMAAYWGMLDETQNVLRDGWLHTRDRGKVDAAGYITIVETNIT